jgi:hypothetical protein
LKLAIMATCSKPDLIHPRPKTISHFEAANHMRTLRQKPKQTLRQLREALWYVEENPKQSFQDVTTCLMVLHDALQELINHHEQLSLRSTEI